MFLQKLVIFTELCLFMIVLLFYVSIFTFQADKYLSVSKRLELSKVLNLTEVQVNRTKSLYAGYNYFLTRQISTKYFFQILAPIGGFLVERTEHTFYVVISFMGI